jgi:hypothetical protein
VTSSDKPAKTGIKKITKLTKAEAQKNFEADVRATAKTYRIRLRRDK